jgi:hypothetical protein
MKSTSNNDVLLALLAKQMKSEKPIDLAEIFLHAESSVEGFDIEKPRFVFSQQRHELEAFVGGRTKNRLTERIEARWGSHTLSVPRGNLNESLGEYVNRKGETKRKHIAGKWDDDRKIRRKKVRFLLARLSCNVLNDSYSLNRELERFGFELASFTDLLSFELPTSIVFKGSRIWSLEYVSVVRATYPERSGFCHIYHGQRGSETGFFLDLTRPMRQNWRDVPSHTFSDNDYILLKERE